MLPTILTLGGGGEGIAWNKVEDGINPHQLMSRLKDVERDGKKRAEWDPFYELDDQYYVAKNGDEIYRMADKYANEGAR